MRRARVVGAVAIAAGSIAKGDHLEVTWTEPAGTPFSLGLTATRVVDTNRGHH